MRIFVIALLGMSTSAVGAQEPAAREYGIRPGYYGYTTLPGDHFTYALEPGVSIDDAVEIFNFTDEPLRFDLYGADLITTSDGAFAPAARVADPRDSGAWIAPERATVDVDPHGSVLAPFTVTVPDDATPGDHPGTIVVEKRIPAPSRSGVAIQPRLALRVLLTVPGEVDVGVDLGALRASREDGTVRFSLPVRNTGNVTFTATGTVAIDSRSITGTDRIEVALQPEGLYAVPGGEATLEAVWDDPPWIGRARTNAQVEVMAGDRDPMLHTTETITVWIVPWTAIVSALAMIVFLAILLHMTREQRHTWLRHRREERQVLRDYRAERRQRDASKHPPRPKRPLGV